jgi:hypothetical protein
MDKVYVNKEGRTVLQHNTCGYCGEGIDPTDPRAHIFECKKHPSRMYARENLNLKDRIKDLEATIEAAGLGEMPRGEARYLLILGSVGQPATALQPEATQYVAHLAKRGKLLYSTGTKLSPMRLAALKGDERKAMERTALASIVAELLKGLITDAVKELIP